MGLLILGLIVGGVGGALGAVAMRDATARRTAVHPALYQRRGAPEIYEMVCMATHSESNIEGAVLVLNQRLADGQWSMERSFWPLDAFEARFERLADAYRQP